MYIITEDPLGGFAVCYQITHRNHTVLQGRLPSRQEARRWLDAYKEGKRQPSWA